MSTPAVMHSPVALATPPTPARRSSCQERDARRSWEAGIGGALQVTLALTGRLDVARLRRACAALSERREILRAVASTAAPMSIAMEPGGRDDVALCDLTALPEAMYARCRARCAGMSLERVSRRALDTPLHVALLRSGEMRHELVLTCSPLVADAGTMWQCCREILDRYHGCASTEPPLPYAAVVDWQYGLLEDEEAQAGARYWAGQRARAFEPAQLPFETSASDGAPRERRDSHRALRLDLDGVDDVHGAAAWMQTTERTRAAFWLACWQALFQRLAGGTPLVTGVLADGRRYDELCDVVGPLDRVLPVASLARGSESIRRTTAALETRLQEHAAWQEYYGEATGDVTREALDVASARAVDGAIDRAIGEVIDETSAGAIDEASRAGWTAPWHVGFACVRWPAVRKERSLRADTVDAIVDTTGARLTLVVHDRPDGRSPRLQLHYDRRAFTREAVRRLGRWLVTISRAAAARPDAPLDTLSLLAPAEREEIVTTWNATARTWPDGSATTLVEWLEAQAARTPDAVAVWTERSRGTHEAPEAPAAYGTYEDHETHETHGTRWTYAELHAHANTIARDLRALGVGPEARVGVWMPRSPRMVAALVGVLKAGAAYVPLDPSYPAARLAFQMVDARVHVVLTVAECAAAIPASTSVMVLDEPPPLRAPLDVGARGHDAARVSFVITEPLDAPARTVSPDARPALGASPSSPSSSLPSPPDAGGRGQGEGGTLSPVLGLVPDHLAYVIYTSGSTGQPKGAMNSHRGIVNRLHWMQATYSLHAGDRVLQKTSSSFDVSVWELFWPLGTGATLVLAAPGGQQDPGYLAALIDRAGVTVLHFVPAMLEAFVTAGGLASCASVRLMVCSGEALPGPLAARTLAAWNGQLDNLYGPTEAAVDVTWQPCTPAMTRAAVVPIGRPVANTQVYVQDAAGHAAPVGVVGELLLGGVQVGRGYWGRPALTAERFIPDSFGSTPGARVYRTGDLTRSRADGIVEYIGRIDSQVKLHGNRIELGEIEAALRAQPGIRDAVVLMRDDGHLRLVAYVVTTSPAAMPSLDELSGSLRVSLPDYMVPAVIVPLDAFPLTPNGKIDRRALPAPSSDRPALAQTYTAPGTQVEEILVRVWSEVLRLDRVGIHDNFFALGGDSILSLQIVARAMQAGWRVAPRQVFEHPTIAALARVAQIASATLADQRPLVGPVPLTPIQHWFFSHDLPAPHHFNQAVRLELAPEALAVLDETWMALQRHHDALRFRYARTAEGWIQHGTDVDTASHVLTIDLRQVPHGARGPMEERVAASMQASLDLTRGPVARAVVLLTADAPAHVLFVLHHLVVDGVSWRILLVDFEVASRQLHAGRPVALPPRTTSMRQWADALRTAAASDAIQAELPVWVETSAPAATLPRDRASAPNTIRASRTQAVTLSREETQALLQELPARGAGQVLEALLASLVQALAGWTGEPTWRIDLEGHGREALSDDIDVSRTVGWFTAIYPVRLAAAARPLDTLRGVKTTLRKVPQNGLGYGLLRYLDVPSAEAVRAAPPAEIMVNYLGQADQALAPAGWVRPGTGPSGSMRHRDAPREYLLEINGIVLGGQLRLTWIYSPHVHQPSVIAGLTERFVNALRTLIAEALATEAEAAVASDFRDVDLDDSELERITRLLDA